MGKNRVIFLSVILLLTVLLICSCSQEETEELIPELSVSPEYIHTAPGGITSFIIANDGNGELKWELETDVEWLVFGKKEGRGTKEISIRVADEVKEGSTTTIRVNSNAGSAEVEFAAISGNVATVEEFDARGITAPEGKVDPTIISNLDKSNNTMGSTKIDPANIKKYQVPDGYETGYIFSWKKVKNVDGYQIYKITDEGDELLVDIEPSQLEEVDDSLVYVELNDDEIGTVNEFKIRAYVDTLKGDFSEDYAVILPESNINLPSDKTNVRVENPLFSWEEINNIAGYQLMVAEGEEENIKHRENFNEDTKEFDGFKLDNGSYHWGILTVGQGSNASGLSLSEFNEFEIKLD